MKEFLAEKRKHFIMTKLASLASDCYLMGIFLVSKLRLVVGGEAGSSLDLLWVL